MSVLSMDAGSIVELLRSDAKTQLELPDFQFILVEGSVLFFYYNITHARVVAAHFTKEMLKENVAKFLAAYDICGECRDTDYQLMIFYNAGKPIADALLVELKKSNLKLKKFSATGAGCIALTSEQGYVFEDFRKNVEKYSMPSGSRLPVTDGSTFTGSRYKVKSSALISNPVKTEKGKSSPSKTTTSTTTTTTTTTATTTSKPATTASSKGVAKPLVPNTGSEQKEPAYLIDVNSVGLINMNKGREIACFLYDGAAALALFDSQLHWLAIAVVGVESTKEAVENAIQQCWHLLKTRLSPNDPKTSKKHDWVYQIISPKKRENLEFLQDGVSLRLSKQVLADPFKVRKLGQGDSDILNYQRPIFCLANDSLEIVEDDGECEYLKLDVKEWAKSKNNNDHSMDDVGFLTGQTTAIELNAGDSFQGSMMGRAYYMTFSAKKVVLLSYSYKKEVMTVMQVDASLLEAWTAETSMSIGHFSALVSLNNYPESNRDLVFQIFWPDREKLGNANKDPIGRICVNYQYQFPVFYKYILDNGKDVFTQREEGEKFKLARLDDPVIKGIAVSENTPYFYISLDGETIRVQARADIPANANNASWPKDPNHIIPYVNRFNIRRVGQIDNRIPHKAPVVTQHS